MVDPADIEPDVVHDEPPAGLWRLNPLGRFRVFKCAVSSTCLLLPTYPDPRRSLARESARYAGRRCPPVAARGRRRRPVRAIGLELTRLRPLRKPP